MALVSDYGFLMCCKVWFDLNACVSFALQTVLGVGASVFCTGLYDIIWLCHMVVALTSVFD